KASIDRPTCRSSKCCHNVVDSRLVQCFRHRETWIFFGRRSHGDPTALVFGNAALVVVVEWPIGTGFASGMRQLDPGESSLRVHEFNDRCQRIALAIVPQPKILW